MRVTVKTPGAPTIRLALPTALLCSPLLSGLICRQAEKYGGVALTPALLREMAGVIRQTRRQFPDWMLVEVDAADGTRVRIRL